jgi:hypothetical protein
MTVRLRSGLSRRPRAIGHVGELGAFPTRGALMTQVCHQLDATAVLPRKMVARSSRDVPDGGIYRSNSCFPISD